MASHRAAAQRTLAAAVRLRRWPALLALGLAATLACSSVTASPAVSPSSAGPPERPALRVAVGGQGHLIYLPLTLAQSLGYFKAEGLALDVQDLKGGAQALAALREGAVDVVAGLYEHTLRTQADGGSAEMIAVFDVNPGLVLTVNQKHQDAHSIKDLATLRIGITAAASPADELVRYLFKQNGLDPNSAQTVAVGSGPAATLALKNDQVQALVAGEPSASMLEQNGEGTVIYDTRTVQGTRDVFGGPWPAGGLYLTTAFVKQNPRTAAALARVVVKTLRYIRAHPVETIASELPADLFYADGNRAFFAQVLKANLGMYSADGMMPADGPSNVLQTLRVADTKTDWASVDLKTTYDNAYVKAAANAH